MVGCDGGNSVCTVAVHHGGRFRGCGAFYIIVFRGEGAGASGSANGREEEELGTGGVRGAEGASRGEAMGHAAEGNVHLICDRERYGDKRGGHGHQLLRHVVAEG